MKTSITCDDEYEAQKLMSLIFIKEDKETYITGILNIIKNLFLFHELFYLL